MHKTSLLITSDEYQTRCSCHWQFILPIPSPSTSIPGSKDLDYPARQSLIFKRVIAEQEAHWYRHWKDEMLRLSSKYTGKKVHYVIGHNNASF